jgi:transcriptional regulator with XRE-family HTH domain
MVTPNNIVRRWLISASPAQARQLASAAKTSVPHLRHIAAGRRNVSADLAQRIAHASVRFPLPLHLLQTELCVACAKCPLIESDLLQ